MVVECESLTDIEIIIGTYEEFVLGYKLMKTEDGVDLNQSFANHSHRASVRCVAGGGRFMASGGADDLIQLYDMKLRKEMSVLMHHDKTVTCLVFIGKSHLASGSDDGELVLWRTGNWQCEKTFKAHPDGGISAIAVHPSGKLCLTAGKDQKLRTWSLVKGRAAYTTNLRALVDDLAWSVTGDHYAVLKLVKGGAQYSVDIYETATAAVVYAIVPESRPSSIYFLEDHIIAVGTISGKIELHTLTDKALLCSWQAHEGRVRCLRAVKFTTGGMWLVSVTNNGDIAVWKYQMDAESKGKPEALKRLGGASAGCRVTSMTLIAAPAGAVPCKTEKDSLENLEDIKEEIPIVAAPKTREKVIIELEDSEEEEPYSQIPSKSKKMKVDTKKKKSKQRKKLNQSGLIKQSTNKIEPKESKEKNGKQSKKVIKNSSIDTDTMKIGPKKPKEKRGKQSKKEIKSGLIKKKKKIKMVQK